MWGGGRRFCLLIQIMAHWMAPCQSMKTLTWRKLAQSRSQQRRKVITRWWEREWDVIEAETIQTLSQSPIHKLILRQSRYNWYKIYTVAPFIMREPGPALLSSPLSADASLSAGETARPQTGLRPSLPSPAPRTISDFQHLWSCNNRVWTFSSHLLKKRPANLFNVCQSFCGSGFCLDICIQQISLPVTKSKKMFLDCELDQSIFCRVGDGWYWVMIFVKLSVISHVKRQT